MRCRMIGGWCDGEVYEMPDSLRPVIYMARRRPVTVFGPINPLRQTFYGNEYRFMEWCPEMRTAYYRAV